MCGIFAAFALNDARLSFNHQEAVAEASALLKRRGPDYFGSHITTDRRAFFCHSRLAIQGKDPDSNQPYHSSNGSIVLYNGELYNPERFYDVPTNYNGTSDTPLFAEIVSTNISRLSELEAMFSFLCYSC